ncbi:MAG: two-component system, LytTR family, sensor kinase [Pyrinomonadaceae bacterium]|nr:two-component system, LytTR family, sensor kinase [Pyrinomonadaceae bacterium]
MPFKRVRAILILVGVWTLIGLTFASLSFFGTLAISDYRRVDLVGIFVWNLTAFYLWALLAPLIALLARRHRLDRQHWPRSLFLVHLPASLVFPALHLCLYLSLYWLAGGVLTREFPTILSFFSYQLFANLPLKVSIYWLILIAINALDYYHSFRVAEVKASELRAQLAQAQLRALKMQLHPHFLFNTLNSISALLHRDAEAADQMVARLGDFLRLTLENSGDQEVTLEQELAFLRCYLEIETVRHDRLCVETDVEPETLGALVPNLILQPLVENAIRHGISRQSAPGRLAIRAARRDGRLWLQVEDNGPGLLAVGETDAPAAPDELLTRTLAGGVGLANTRARLEHLYGAGGRLELAPATPRGMIVTLEIPFQVEAAVAELTEEEEAGAVENYKPELARVDRAAG